MDDIIKLIIMNLKLSDIYACLYINKYWSEHTSKILTDDKFWKLQIDKRYYFMGKCLQGKSYKDKYLTFSSISEDEVHVIFGHYRNVNKMLYSEISIRELLKDNVDALILASIIGFDQCDLETCRWKFDMTADILNYHCGDCNKVSFACVICSFENSLILGLKNLNTWISAYDVSIFEIACIIVSTKHIYEDRRKIRYCDRSDDCWLDFDEYPFIEMTLKEQMQCWLDLTDERRGKIKDEINEMIKTTKF